MTGLMFLREERMFSEAVCSQRLFQLGFAFFAYGLTMGGHLGGWLTGGLTTVRTIIFFMGLTISIDLENKNIQKLRNIWC
jgi:hypothetical protein